MYLAYVETSNTGIVSEMVKGTKVSIMRQGMFIWKRWSADHWSRILPYGMQ